VLVSVQRQLERGKPRRFGRTSTGASPVSSPGAFQTATAPRTSSRTSCCASTATQLSSSTRRPSAHRSTRSRETRSSITTEGRRSVENGPGSIDLDRQEQPVFGPPLTEPRSKLAKCLGPLLRRLPAIDREALALTALEASAAARLGLSTSGMKSRVQRPRAQLRPLLVACCENDLDRRGDITSYRSRRGPRDCRMTTPRGVGTVTPYLPACALRRPVLGRSE
jgi:hypothetical protein